MQEDVKAATERRRCFAFGISSHCGVRTSVMTSVFSFINTMD
jgi:hypothetical protein